jgi:hypothetical protein
MGELSKADKGIHRDKFRGGRVFGISFESDGPHERFGASGRFDDVRDLLEFDGNGEDKMESENGRIKPCKHSLVKGARIESKENTTFPALAEERAWEGMDK